jgi:G3E family GTPase
MTYRPGHDGTETFTVVRERPLPALALTLLLQAVAEHCGARLLRFKGLVAIDEMPGRPAVIHGVRHVVSPPEFLDCWPSGDARTRIVFIARGVPRYFVARLLDAIEEEVRDAMDHLVTSDRSGN